MLVVKGESVLLLRRAHAPRIGWIDVPGGFLEAGESLETCARRELREETGLVVGRAEPLAFHWDEYWLRGFGRFPTMNWYFVARWRGGQPAASDDAASTEWVPVSKLASMRRRFSWSHMHELFADLGRWMAQRPAAHRSFAGKPEARDPVTRDARARRAGRRRA